MCFTAWPCPVVETTNLIFLKRQFMYSQQSSLQDHNNITEMGVMLNFSATSNHYAQIFNVNVLMGKWSYLCQGLYWPVYVKLAHAHKINIEACSINQHPLTQILNIYIPLIGLYNNQYLYLLLLRTNQHFHHPHERWLDHICFVFSWSRHCQMPKSQWVTIFPSFPLFSRLNLQDLPEYESSEQDDDD